MTKRCGWVAGLLLLIAAQARADGPGAAAWVDREAMLYVELMRPTALLDGFEDARFQAGIAAVPGAREALEDPRLAELHHVIGVVADQLGVSPAKGFRDLTGGGVVLAVEGDKGSERLILIVSPADPGFLDRAYAKVLELATADAANNGKPAPFARSEYRGISLASAGPKQAMAIVANRLVVTNGVETLKSVIDRANDAKFASIPSHSGWSSSRSATGRQALAFGFARLDRLRAIDPAKYGGTKVNPGFSFLFGPWYESIRKSEWTAVSLGWSDDRLAAEISLPNPPGGRSPALGRYVPTRGAGAPARLTPPRMIASLGLWRDLASIWEVRAEIFPPEVLEQLAQLDTFAGQFFGGRDFGTGVLGSISSEWRLVVARQDDAAMDPVPDLKLPAFALVINLAAGDEEFATRLMSAFQSFVGLVNIGAAQTKAPPLMLGSEILDGTTIATSKFVAAKARPGDPPTPVDRRFNFSPSAARVGDTFFISSTLGLARDLVIAAKNPAKSGEETLAIVADGDELARLVDQNRAMLVMQDMLKKGRDKATSEAEIGKLAALIRYLHQARLSAVDDAAGLKLRLEVSPKP